MSAELIGILSVGVALAGVGVTFAGLILASVKELRDDMRRIESRLDSLEQCMTRLEGVLDGLREALFGRARERVGE